MKRLILIICFIFLASYALAAVHYVSTTGTATWASSVNIGTPCALNTACNSVVAGDTVYLRDGIYNKGIIINGRSGNVSNKITFAAYEGETPIIANSTTYLYTGRYHGLLLQYSDYYVFSGITFNHVSGSYFVQVVKGSDHVEIGDCFFDGTGRYGSINFWKGDSALGDTAAVTHLWVHGCTFADFGVISSVCDDAGGIQIGMFASPYDHVSGYQTWENNTFYSGGHHLVETFSKYNVLRNNFFHHEGSMAKPATSCEYGPDSNDLYGNRNIQIYDGSSNTGMFNILESNRFGPSGPPPDDDGGDGMTITAPKNIIRFNEVYSAQNNGIYFKAGSGSLSDNNRFYNNTVVGSGRYQNTGPQWQGVDFRCAGIYMSGNISSIQGVGGTVTCNISYTTRMKPGSIATIASTVRYNGNWTVLTVAEDGRSFTFAKSGDTALETTGTARGTGPQIGNSVINNLLYNGTSGNIALVGSFDTYNRRENNYATATGDPLFTDGTLPSIDTTPITTDPDLTLQAESPAIDAGTYLTQAAGAGTDSVTLTVDDALYFQDGTWGSSLSDVQADWIAIGTVTNVVQISSIDYTTNVITLTVPMTWDDNASIWLYRDSDGTRVLSGAAPDQGAHESNAPDTVVSGTIVGDLGLTEDEIVTGGQALALTLLGTTWAADVVSDAAKKAALIAGITGNLSEAGSWNSQVTITNVTLTSDTVVTIVLPASAGYDITARETVSAQIAAALTAANEIINATPTITIDIVTPTPPSGSAKPGMTKGASTASGAAKGTTSAKAIQ